MFNYLKQKLGKKKDVPATEQFYTPLRVALHSTLTLTSVDMITLAGVLHPLFIQPQGDLEVLAIGTLDMNGTTVFQVYVQDSAEEEFILQIVEGKDFRTGKPTADEITLYKQVFTLQPETETSLTRALGDIGFLTMELDGVSYDRIWGDQFTEKMDFRTYNERVVTPQGTEHYVDNYILYGRSIRGITGEEVNEFLLVGLEENDNEAQIMMQVGLGLNINDIAVQ